MRGKSLLTSIVDAVPSAATVPPRDAANLVSRIVAAVRTVAFWVAVLVPLAYPPLLVAGSGSLEVGPLLGVLGLHAVVLVVGHVPDDRERDAAEAVDDRD